MIWDDLPQETIRKSIVSFPRRLRACVNARSRQFRQNGLMNLVINISVLTTNSWFFSALKRVTCAKYACNLAVVCFVCLRC